VKHDLYLKLIQSRVNNLEYSNRKFVNIKGDPFDIASVITVDIALENFANTLRIALFVLKESQIPYDIILGRDFIAKEKFLITCDKKIAGLGMREKTIQIYLRPYPYVSKTTIFFGQYSARGG